MKSLTIFTALAIAIWASSPVNSSLTTSFIDSINEKQSNWVAGHNFPENTTLKYLKKLNGLKGFHRHRNHKLKSKKHNLNASAGIPASFDAREKWPHCRSLGRIRDQGRSCGSCWAFATAEVLSDRICIQSNGLTGLTNDELSPEDLLTCCPNCGDCDGGYIDRAFDYYKGCGLVTGGDFRSYKGCKPYSFGAFLIGYTPTCSHHCRNGYPISYLQDKRNGTFEANYYLFENSIKAIQNEIMTNGPVVASFEMFEDFFEYKSGVYHHVKGESVGGHAVKIIGWGIEKDTSYWLIANSWGTNWGDNGFFKMRRGTNECRIENEVYAFNI